MKKWVKVILILFGIIALLFGALVLFYLWLFISIIVKLGGG